MEHKLPEIPNLMIEINLSVCEFRGFSDKKYLAKFSEGVCHSMDLERAANITSALIQSIQEAVDERMADLLSMARTELDRQLSAGQGTKEAQ